MFVYADAASRISRRNVKGGDIVPVPDSVWEAEKNYTLTHPERSNLEVRQAGNPPSNACMKIKVVYDRNFAQKSGGDGESAARAVMDEAQNIFSTKFASNNQLGTSFTFNLGNYNYN